MSSTSYAKEIVYSPEDRDFACYLDGELVSFARTHQEGEALLDELVTRLMAAALTADDTVYCEACGVAVDPAAAVLDGELMVCPGCAPCSAAEFEAMQMAEAERLMAAEIIEATYPVLDAALEANDTDAYYSALRAANESLDALAPDPQTWAYVSEVPCELDDTAELDAREAALAARCDCFALGIEQPACLAAGRPLCEPRQWPAGAVSSISRAELFDALCQAADELRDYWCDVPKRVEAINVAWEWVMLQSVYHFNAQGDLLVPSSSDPSKVYAVGHTCPCTAGRWGNHCKHATVADLIGRARRIARLKAA